MAYNFLTLVNDINKRVNEVELTSSNFSTATGFYSTAKEAVNSALHEINHHVFQWPFNYTLNSVTLTAGDNRYSYPANAKWVDFHTFRIQRDDALGNETFSLKRLDYEEYLKYHVDDEYNTDTSIRDVPRYVAQTPSREIILHPVPDQAYTLDYEYYTIPADLSAFDDVPTVPEQFRTVIINGAMYYVYQFRSDLENSQSMYSKFQQGLKDMRKIYQNRYVYMRDTRVEDRPATAYRNL